MKKKTSLSLVALAAATLALSGPAYAADPTGTWLSQDGDTKIKVVKCGDAICGSISWLKQPNEANGKPKTDSNNPDASKRSRSIIGVPIVLAMKPDGAGKWSGKIYNAEDGKTYSGSFTLAGANKADMKGCVAIICKTKAWTRSN